MPSSRWHRGYDTAVILWHPVSKFFLGVPRKFCHISTHTHTYIYIYNIHTHCEFMYIYIHRIPSVPLMPPLMPSFSAGRVDVQKLGVHARLFDPETILKPLSSKTSLIILHRIWGYPYEDQ
jgi:hypothetical protein